MKENGKEGESAGETKKETSDSMESSSSAVKDDSESSEKTTTTTTATTTTTDEERKDETQTSTKESSSDVDSGQFTQSTQSSDESKEAEEKMKESQTLTSTTSNAVLECDGLWAESEDREEKEDEEGRNNDDVKKDDGKNEEDSTPTKEKIVIEDHDDYLIYLEDVLKRIHAAFYELYDQKNNKGDESIDTAKTPDEENGKVPDLKHVMPYVRKKILKVNLFVSGGRVSFPYRFIILYSVTLVLHCTLHNNIK